VLLCLAVGLALQALNSTLPQRQQEMLECVVAAIAVVMVSYMVLWMRKHSRSLKSDLHAAAGGALASGSAAALVLMAFLAVFREGFETAVFLLAAFQSAVSPPQAVAGAVLGILVAVALGRLVYRGGVKLNLSKFFTRTGVVLVLVAAGLVISTLRAAYEAGWIVVGQQHAVSLDVIARPGTVQESLLTGVLGIRSSMPVIEVVAYLLYLVPMLAVVLWPAKRALSGARLVRVLVCGGAGAAVIAAGLLAFSPATPVATNAQLPLMSSTAAATGTQGMSPDGGGTVSMSVTSTTLRLDGVVAGTAELSLSGHATVAGMSAAVYTGTPIRVVVDPAGSGAPSTVTVAQVAALGGGRLPIGLDGTGTGPLRTSFTDSWTPQVTVDQATGAVLDLKLTGVRSMAVTTAAGQSFPVGSVGSSTSAATAAAVAERAAAASALAERRADHEVFGQVLPALLLVFGAVLFAFAGPHLVRGRRRAADSAAVSPSTVAAGVGADGGGELLAPLGPPRTN
jgi:high-affinity iron transporter